MQLLDSDFWERAVRIKYLPPSHGVCMESNAQIFSWTELGCDSEPHFSILLPWSPTIRVASSVLPLLACGCSRHSSGGLVGTKWDYTQLGRGGWGGHCVALSMSQFITAVSKNFGDLTNILKKRQKHLKEETKCDQHFFPNIRVNLVYIFCIQCNRKLSYTNNLLILKSKHDQKCPDHLDGGTDKWEQYMRTQQHKLKTLVMWETGLPVFDDSINQNILNPTP